MKTIDENLLVLKKMLEKDATASEIKRMIDIFWPGNDVPLAALNVYEKAKQIKGKKSQYELEETVTQVLDEIGIPRKLIGYNYLRYSIIMTVNDPDLIHGITKKLYPLISEKFNTTPTRAERAIRHAIETAWKNGNKEILEVYFRFIGISGGAVTKATNMEFIAMLADKIRMHIEHKSI